MNDRTAFLNMALAVPYVQYVEGHTPAQVDAVESNICLEMAVCLLCWLSNPFSGSFLLLALSTDKDDLDMETEVRVQVQQKFISRGIGGDLWDNPLPIALAINIFFLDSAELSMNLPKLPNFKKS